MIFSIGIVSRLTGQKGMDLVIESIGYAGTDGGPARPARFGDGASRLHFPRSQNARGRVGVVLGYDEALSHLLQAGSDAILIPSRSSLPDSLYGLRYGCVPRRSR